MTYLERHRDRITAPLAETLLFERARQVGFAQQSIKSALIYLDCGCIEEAVRILEQALAQLEEPIQ